MNINYYVKCNVCGSVTRMRLQVGWLKEHPVHIYCGKCGILLEGKVVQDQENIKVGIAFKNAVQTDEDSDFFIEASGEFPSCKMMEDEGMVSSITTRSPFIRYSQMPNQHLFRKYFGYADDSSEKIHHRALDVRLCIGLVCDHILFLFMDDEVQSKWKNYDLAKKLSMAKRIMDEDIVNAVRIGKNVGNTGVHEGEEGECTEEDIKESLDAIRKFSLEVFNCYFEKNGFEPAPEGSWIPVIFSTLPPAYRIEILKKYYCKHPSYFVADKLAKAYLKDNRYEEARSFLGNCLKEQKISNYEYKNLLYDIEMMKPHLDKFPIAKNLEQAKENFKTVLSALKEEDRDSFVCLMSMILLGDNFV